MANSCQNSQKYVYIYIGAENQRRECWHGISKDIVCTAPPLHFPANELLWSANCWMQKRMKISGQKKTMESVWVWVCTEIPDQLKLNQFLSGLWFCISKSSNIYYKMSACCSPDTCHSHRYLRLMPLSPPPPSHT